MYAIMILDSITLEVFAYCNGERQAKYINPHNVTLREGAVVYGSTLAGTFIIRRPVL